MARLSEKIKDLEESRVVSIDHEEEENSSLSHDGERDGVIIGEKISYDDKEGASKDGEVDERRFVDHT
jgi:hypothetical protein